MKRKLVKRQLVMLSAVALLSGLLGGCAKEYVPVGANWQAVHSLQPGGRAFSVDADGPSRVRLGETLRFTVSSEKSGRLWVVHVDASDRITLLYPGNNSPSNWIDKAETVSIPSKESGQLIRAVEPRGLSTVAFIVTDPDTDLYQALSGDNASMSKALGIVQARPSWGIRHLVVNVE